MDLYSYSKEESVTYAFDNYLEKLALFKGKYIFIMWTVGQYKTASYRSEKFKLVARIRKNFLDGIKVVFSCLITQERKFYATDKE